VVIELRRNAGCIYRSCALTNGLQGSALNHRQTDAVASA